MGWGSLCKELCLLWFCIQYHLRPNHREKRRRTTLYCTYAGNWAREDEDVALREEIAVGGCFFEVLMFTGCDDNYGGWLGCCNGGDAFCKVRVERVDSRNYDGRVFGSQCRVTGDRCGAVDPDADHVYHKSNVAEKE